MANISLYVSGQTELNDVTEFFQKRLIGEGESPIAFFDGVFYESHQERVGNIVYQDYLIYTDKAVYLWARGASKDFLDRFTLGAVAVNSRNKDSAFATLNLKIKREGKEPVYVIFDMVEIREAEAIVKLHTVIESTIEDYLGVNYRQEIPEDTAARILQAGRSVCIPRSVSIPMDEPQQPTPDPGIGYGQDLLEQYKASIGYQNEFPQPGAAQQPRPRTMGMPPGMASGMPPGVPGGADAARSIEGMLPADPAAIKRLAGQLKDMVGDAPFKIREQLMKDFQHVPNDVATVLTALNELLANIAGNPQAERFVMNAIKTAVSSDGIIGSVGKIIKLTGIGTGGGKKSSRPESSSSRDREDPFSRQERSASRRLDDEGDGSAGDTTVRRKKISVREDSNAFDPFADDEPEAAPTVPPASRRTVPDDDGSEPKRRKLTVKAEDDGASDIARKLMSYDESERDEPAASPAAAPLAQDDAAAMEPDAQGPVLRHRKVPVRAEREVDDIAHKLMSYDESGEPEPLAAAGTALHEQEPESEVQESPVFRHRKVAIRTDRETSDIERKLMGYEEQPSGATESDSLHEQEPAVAPSRKKIQIRADVQPAPSLPSDEAVPPPPAAASQPDAGAAGTDYLTLESDLPIPAAESNQPAAAKEPVHSGPRKPGARKHHEGPEKPSDNHSVSVKPTP